MSPRALKHMRGINFFPTLLEFVRGHIFRAIYSVSINAWMCWFCDLKLHHQTPTGGLTQGPVVWVCNISHNSEASPLNPFCVMRHLASSLNPVEIVIRVASSAWRLNDMHCKQKIYSCSTKWIFWHLLLLSTVLTRRNNTLNFCTCPGFVIKDSMLLKHLFLNWMFDACCWKEWKKKFWLLLKIFNTSFCFHAWKMFCSLKNRWQFTLSTKTGEEIRMCEINCLKGRVHCSPGHRFQNLQNLSSWKSIEPQ